MVAQICVCAVFGVDHMVGFAKDVDVKFVVNRLIEVARIW